MTVACFSRDIRWKSQIKKRDITMAIFEHAKKLDNEELKGTVMTIMEDYYDN